MTQARLIGYTGQYLDIVGTAPAQQVDASDVRFTQLVTFGALNPMVETGGINITGWLTSNRNPDTTQTNEAITVTTPTVVPNIDFINQHYVAKWDRITKLNSAPAADSIIRFKTNTTEVIPMTDFGRDVIGYATPEDLSSNKKIPLVDKANEFTDINTILTVKLKNLDVDVNNGKVGKNVVANTDGLTVVGIKPNNTLDRRVTIQGDLYVNGNVKLNNGHQVWTEDNDGSGSGLDADLLDGHHWSEVLQLAADLQGQINNRLRRDINDGTEYSFYVKDLSVLDSNINVFNQTGHSVALNASGTTLAFKRINSDGTNNPIGSRNPMSLDLTTGNVVFASDIQAFSDKTLKTDISSIKNALELVKRVDPVWFTWNGTNKEDLGVIAQQVEEVLPEVPGLVSVDPATGFKVVAYMKFIPLLLAAVKELANDR